jgi:hypothetical protein
MGVRPIIAAVAILALAPLSCLLVQGAPLVDGGLDAGFDGSTECTPGIAVLPGSIDFGSVVVHSVLSRTVTVTDCTNLDVVATPSLHGPEASLFTLSETEPFVVQAQTTVSVTVSYAPDTISTLDSASILFSFNTGNSVVVSLMGWAVQSGLQITPMPLDFGFVQAGASETRTLRLTNVGNVSVMLPAAVIANPGTPPAFSIPDGGWTGGTLAPGESVDLPVSFAPPQAARFEGEIDFTFSDSSNEIPIALVGYGGGAALTCAPRTLDFGVAPTGMTTTLPLICTTTGSDVPGQADLILASVASDNPAFTVQSNPPPPIDLVAGRSVQIDVTYDPNAPTGHDAATLTLYLTHGLDGPDAGLLVWPL